MTRVGVVTIARGRHAHLQAQHRSLAASDRRPDEYVVVAMDDADITPASIRGLRRDIVPIACPSSGLPLAAARNLGCRTVLEAGVDVVVMLDVDCLAGRGLVEAYAQAAVAHQDVIWSGPVTYLPPDVRGDQLDGLDGPGGLDWLDGLDDPHPARPAPRPGCVEWSTRPDLFWSLSLACSASTWLATGGFDEGYTGYGAEDTDFARRSAQAGRRFAWSGSARAYHQHHPVDTPPVQHLDDILRNGRRFRDRWGEWPMAGWLEQFEALGLVRRVGDDWVRAPGD